MTSNVDCLVFGDQMDALVRGILPAEGARQLRLHAEACSDCATQFRVHEHLVGPSLEELEARVPDGLLVGFEEAVLSAARRDRGVGPRPGLTVHPGGGVRAGGSRWMVPALAAASLALLVSTGLLARRADGLEERAAVLALQVEAQQARLEILAADRAPDPVARTAALKGKIPWLRALERRETITLEELMTLLGRIPADRLLLTEGQIDAALRGPAPLGSPALRGLLDRIPAGDRGVRAGELLEALAEAAPDAGLTLRTAELVDLLT